MPEESTQKVKKKLGNLDWFFWFFSSSWSCHSGLALKILAELKKVCGRHHILLEGKTHNREGRSAKEGWHQSSPGQHWHSECEWLITL